MKVIVKSFIRIGITVYLIFYVAMLVAKNKEKKRDRMYDNMCILVKLLEIKDNDIKLSSKFHINKDENVAIYGNGIVGKQIAKQLFMEGIKVSYFIDQKSNALHFDEIPVYRADIDIPKVAVVIVTPIAEYLKIKERLVHNPVGRFVSVGDLLEG